MATELSNEPAVDVIEALTEERKRLSAELSQLVLDAVKIKDEWYPAQVQALRAKKLEQSVFSRGMNQIKDELRQRKLENLRKKREVEGKLSEVNSKLRVHGMKISADAAYRKSQKEAKPDVHLQCLQRIEALLIRIVDHMESRQ